MDVDTLYVALFPNHEDNFLRRSFFEETENKLARLLPGAARHDKVVRVIDASDLPGRTRVKLHADTMKQHVMCYLERYDG